MRALWTQLLPSDDERHIGYAVDSVAFETVFAVAPIVIVGVIATAAGGQAALGVGAILVTGASIALARTPASRRWRSAPRVGRGHLLGPLRSSGVRTMLIVSLGLGGCFGEVEIGIAAFGRAHGDTALMGVLLGVWSVGSVAGGLVLARRAPARDPLRRLLLLLSALAVSNAALGFLDSPLALGAMITVAGAWVAPIYSTSNVLLGELAPAGMLTETFGWTITATTVGMTTASPISGYLIDTFSPSTALACAAVPVALATLLVFGRRGSVRVRTEAV
jgi:hypothetical protein